MSRGIALAMIALVIGGLLAFVTIRMDWDLPGESLGAGGATKGPPDVYVRRAAFHDGRVWIANYGGELWSLAENEDSPRRELEGSEVISLCARGGRLDVLVARDAGWRVMTREGATWSSSADFYSEGDFALPLVCDETPTLLTDRRLIEASTGRTLVRLQERLPTFPDNLASRVGHQIYFSTNSGEAGTMFYRIDATSGAVGLVRDWCGRGLRQLDQPLSEGHRSDPCTMESGMHGPVPTGIPYGIDGESDRALRFNGQTTALGTVLLSPRRRRMHRGVQPPCSAERSGPRSRTERACRDCR